MGKRNITTTLSYFQSFNISSASPSLGTQAPHGLKVNMLLNAAAAASALAQVHMFNCFEWIL